MKSISPIKLASFLWVALACLLPAAPLSAQEQYCHGAGNHRICITAKSYARDVCVALQNNAQRYGLDPHFFARLIWQESRFDPNARSHKNAQGIAQFIPSTARIRGLANPYNPAEALNASARYLAELSHRFGNEGMAAVAYNAGEKRAENYLGRKSGLPRETINYVQIITGYSAEIWRDQPPLQPQWKLHEQLSFLEACIKQASTRSIRNFKPKSSDPPVLAWGVQLASHTSEARARNLWSILKRRYPYLLDKEQPNFIRTTIAGRGPRKRYVVRISRHSRRSANELCAHLRRGGVACAVFRN